MFRRLRQLEISLAAKCQLLFGSAVVLIIAAALFVPWQRMEQLTEDHSLVNELLKSGKLSEEEAQVHPQRSVITRASALPSRGDACTDGACPPS